MKGMESFFKNLKRDSFLVQISRNLSVSVAYCFSFSVKNRFEMVTFVTFSISMPIFSSFEVLMATAAKYLEWEMDISWSRVAK